MSRQVRGREAVDVDRLPLLRALADHLRHIHRTVPFGLLASGTGALFLGQALARPSVLRLLLAVAHLVLSASL